MNSSKGSRVLGPLDAVETGPASFLRNGAGLRRTDSGSHTDELLHQCGGGDGGAASSSSPLSAASPSPVSAVTYHEAAHAVAGAALGLGPLALVTIVPGRFFSGRCVAPGADPHADPAAIVAAVTAICEKARCAMPDVGEDGLDTAGPWLWAARARVIEITSGIEGEKIAGFTPIDPEDSSDMELARIYAGSIAAPAAVEAFIAYCRIEAAALLRAHWHCVQAVAECLEEAKTLTGAEVSETIAEAAGARAFQEERARRRRWAETIARAGAHATFKLTEGV